MRTDVLLDRLRSRERLEREWVVAHSPGGRVLGRGSRGRVGHFEDLLSKDGVDTTVRLLVVGHAEGDGAR
jgi:hypothetical protein